MWFWGLSFDLQTSVRMFGELWLIWMIKFVSKVVAVVVIFFHTCLWWFDWFWVLWCVVFGLS